MTDTPEPQEDDLELPTSTRASRLDRAPRPDPEYIDDVVRADDRIAEFRTKYRGGRIVTSILGIDESDEERVASFDDTTLRTLGWRRFTVIAEVYKTSDALEPHATAHATRGTDDPDPITASRPQETAETAAVSRALRYLGIRLPKD